MRCRSALHLCAALLALVTGLSSPMAAVAHGLAHAHEQEAHGLGHPVPRAPAALGAVGVSADSPPDGEHAYLHAERSAVAHLPVAVLAAPPVASPVRWAVRALRPGIPPGPGYPPQERGSPPDQSRAPPLG